ncbi:MAG: hypothetical protein PVI23_01370 [Maricaulaceae bacterium]|jgi:hypothetical protein
MTKRRGVIIAATVAALCAAVSAAPSQAAGESAQAKSPQSVPLTAEDLASEMIDVMGGLDSSARPRTIEAALHRRLLQTAPPNADESARNAAAPVIADALALVLSEDLTTAQRGVVFDLFRAYAAPDTAAAAPIQAAPPQPPAFQLEALGPPPSIHSTGGSDYTAH